MAGSSIREFMYRVRRTLLDPVAWHLSKPALHRCLTARDPESIVRAASACSGRGSHAHFKLMQDEREFLDMVRVIDRLQPKVIVEIETRSGGTLFAWARASRAAEAVIGIDLPDGRFGGGPTSSARPGWRRSRGVTIPPR